MKNNTVVTAGDINYLWGIFLLIASMRKNGMDEPVRVGAYRFTPEAAAMLEQLGNVRIHHLDSTSRSLTCIKPAIMLLADTEYITWVDSDSFFTGNCSARLIPEHPGEIHIRKRSEQENPQAFRNYTCGEDGHTIPATILDAWRADVGERQTPRNLQSCSACFLSVHKSARPFLERWDEQMMKLLPAGNVGVVDRSLKFYHQLDESVLNSLLCFAGCAPETAKTYRLDKDINELYVHFIGSPKPWRGWTPYSIRHFKRYTDVVNYALAAGFIRPADVPFPLNSAHETLCRIAAPFISLDTKIRNRLKRLTGGK